MNRDISIALAGKWSFEFDHNDQGVSENWFECSLADTIELPGTTDDNQKGEDNLERETLRLTRVHPYIGSAFYQKEVLIPEECQGKRLFFRIERTKHSMVWVDDRLMGERDSLCTSHVYEVTEQLTPGTMGILCDPDHPALTNFPTESHSNWQWWSLLKNGCAMILDDLPGDLQPVVRVIDNCERNHRLGVVFECRVGAGKLIVCSSDLLGQQEYPEARQLLKSLLDYMTSGAFEPGVKVLRSAVEKLFTRSGGRDA